MPTRRETLIGTGAVFVTAAAPPPTPLARIEATLNGGRIGLAALDTVTGRRLAHRADERFPICSTFKLPLAASILAEVAAGRLSLDRPVRFGRADIVSHAPVVEPALALGQLSVGELTRAIMVVSDNAAANLLMPLVGGLGGLTRYMHAQGGAPSRIDHLEPTLNFDAAADPADTATPAAMLALAGRLLIGDAVGRDARAMLIDWMRANRSGLPRLRAGFPAGWIAGDRTGTGPGQANDVAIAWPSGHRPVLIAAYVDAPRATAAVREAALAAAGRIVAVAFDKRRASL